MSSPPPELPTPTAPPAGDVENQATKSRFGSWGIVRRLKRREFLERGSLLLRGLCFLFSLIAFVVMASNKHGDWKNFDNYEEYRYLLAIAILSTLYAGAQTFRNVREASTGKMLFQKTDMVLIDFICDQVMAYMLISAASSAVPITNRFRQGADNVFTDSSVAAITMMFFAFLAQASSALISGHTLSNKSYL